MGKGRRRWPLRMTLLLMATLLIIIPKVGAVTRGAAQEHIDWPDSCIRAYSLTFTAEEYDDAQSAGILRDTILRESSARVLYGEDRSTYTGGFQSVDIGALPQSAVPGTYPVTFALFSGNKEEDAITIKLTILNPPAPAETPTPEPTLSPEPTLAPSPTLTPTPAPTEAPTPAPEPTPMPEPTPTPRPVPTSAPTPAPPPPPPDDPPPPQVLPKYTYIVAYTASGVSALWLLLLIIPQVGVVIWHRRKRRQALMRTAEDWAREEKDE